MTDIHIHNHTPSDSDLARQVAELKAEVAFLGKYVRLLQGQISFTYCQLNAVSASVTNEPMTAPVQMFDHDFFARFTEEGFGVIK